MSPSNPVNRLMRSSLSRAIPLFAGMPVIVFALIAGCSSQPAKVPDPVVTPTTPPAPAEELADLSWMSGCWSSNDPDRNVWTEECWSTVVGDLMIGASRTLRDGRVVAFEQIRIELRNGYVWYVPSPGGTQTVSFLRVTPTTADRGTSAHTAVFENAQHDFPQRIVYRGDGQTYLEAVLAGEVIDEDAAGGTGRPRPIQQRWIWRR